MNKKNSRRPPPTHENIIEIARLFQECREQLEGFLAERLGSRDEARELAQEAYERLVKYRPKGTIDHWRALLFRTARNLAANRLRQRRLRRDKTMFIELKNDYTPELHLQASQERAAVRAAIEELPERSRNVIDFLIADPPLTFDQIAKRLDVCTRTCRRDYKDAIASIRRALRLRGSRK